MLHIIPPDPDWTQAQESLATALAAGANQTNGEAACVWFLLRQDPEAWASVQARHAYRIVRPNVAVIAWEGLETAVGRIDRLSPNTRAAVQLACWMADRHVKVPPADCHAELSATNKELFAQAFECCRAGAR